jgi:acyl dehydratase
MEKLYFEDFRVGDAFDLGTCTMAEERMIAFAREFDPQPFHVDRDAARASIYGGLIASGWHTSAAFMRLLVDGLLHRTASLGATGIEALRWMKPVRPGDLLRGRFTVEEVVPSQRRSDRGTVRSLSELINQRDEVVMSVRGYHLFGRRPA